MKIGKVTNVKLTPDEVEKIIIDHLASKGIKVDTVYFSVNGHEQEGDWRSEYPLNYTLDEVVCSGTED